MRPPPPVPHVVTDEGVLRALCADSAGAHRLAIDIEASGMFAYRARPCTVQMAWGDGAPAELRIAVVDTLATSIEPLAGVLGVAGPVKIVHDVAFDARLLAECGIDLGNVHDTSISARMLGRTATGLASLLESELGLHISKTMQHHDWRVRPLDATMIEYLATDVLYLEELERHLWAQVLALGIEDAVLEETRHRIATATASARRAFLPPPYTRVKGAARLAPRELAALRVLAELREREAERRDVPPHNVASADALIAIARARPTTNDGISRVRGLSTATPEGRAFAVLVIESLRSAGDAIPEDERPYFEPERLPPAVSKARRERESRLLAWRRDEAKRRGVDEQVVLPGHCVKDAVDASVADVEDLLRVAGIGTFRVHRDGAAIVSALRGDGVATPAVEDQGAVE